MSEHLAQLLPQPTAPPAPVDWTVVGLGVAFGAFSLGTWAAAVHGIVTAAAAVA